MRNFQQLVKTFKFKNFVSKSYVTNTEGKKTGETTTTYTDLQTAKGSVSANKGYAEQMVFGSLDGYDRVITTTKDYGVNETSIIWLEADSTTQPHDYEVLKVSKSRNFVVIAVRKVKVS